MPWPICSPPVSTLGTFPRDHQTRAYTVPHQILHANTSPRGRQTPIRRPHGTRLQQGALPDDDERNMLGKELLLFLDLFAISDEHSMSSIRLISKTVHRPLAPLS